MMSTLGKHCKGYPLKLFRQFPRWTENRKNARRVRQEVNGEMVEVQRDLTDSTYLYLQEDFTVTDSIFVDENIIFDNVTVEWIDYCLNVLGVQFPSSESMRSVVSAHSVNGKNA
ncbi:MAG TPA: hypothetical protein VJM12_07470 [Pyrinomonadaceae bacterium]|nr:hypothetical protein [Pyrinomonadaceae bacterium]